MASLANSGTSLLQLFKLLKQRSPFSLRQISGGRQGRIFNIHKHCQRKHATYQQNRLLVLGSLNFSNVGNQKQHNINQTKRTFTPPVQRCVSYFNTDLERSSTHTLSQSPSLPSVFHDAKAVSALPASRASSQKRVLECKYPPNLQERHYHKVSPKSSVNRPLLSLHPLLSTAKNVPPDSLYHQPRSSYSIAKSILDSSPSSWKPYMHLIRFDKPIGTWLLYWPCTWSIALAAQPGCLPDFKMLALFGAGAFFMRGAGCIINDMWDKDFDSKVSRTKERPLANEDLTYFQALVFLGSQLSISLAILLQMNWYTVILGAASMSLVITYPLAKRYTYWPQVVLGLTLNWGVLLAWSGLQGELQLSALLLYGACTCHTVIYDTVYTHQDKYDDMLIGVKSTALRLGDQTKPWLTGFSIVMNSGLIGCGLLNDMPWPYYLGVGLTAAKLLQQIYAVDLDDEAECAKAFRSNFYLGVVMFTGIVLANLMKPKQQDGDDKVVQSAMQQDVV